jgi:hypothetical protein
LPEARVALRQHVKLCIRGNDMLCWAALEDVANKLIDQGLP